MERRFVLADIPDFELKKNKRSVHTVLDAVEMEALVLQALVVTVVEYYL